MLPNVGQRFCRYFVYVKLAKVDKFDCQAALTPIHSPAGPLRGGAVQLRLGQHEAVGDGDDVVDGVPDDRVVFHVRARRTEFA